MQNALTFSDSISSPITGRWTTVARVVSDLFSPAAVAVPCIALCVLASDVPGTYWYGLLYFAIAIPLPVAYVVWLVQSGRVTDFHLPDRRDRKVPFALTMICALGALGVLVFLQAPSTIVAPIIAALSQTALLFLITLVWQISIHASTTTALVTFAVLALGGEATILAVLIPVVGWARIHLGRHNMTQIVAGALVGLACFGGLFALRGIAW
jgi:membrane-associated phospholipid phosphatase